MKVGLTLLLILAGYIAATFVASIVFRALKRTNLDNRVAKFFGLKPASGDRIERIAQSVTFYLIMATVLVAVLDFAGLDQAAGTISALIGSVMSSVLPMAKAGAIVLVAFLVATGLRAVIKSALSKTSIGGTLAEWSGERAPTKPVGFSNGVATFVYWLVLFFGITAGMEALGITALVSPLTGLISKAMSMLPAPLVAGVIAAVGWFGGKLVGKVVTNLLASARLDDLTARIKLDKVFAKRPASAVVGLIVTAFIILQAGIAALDKLGIAALSEPLTAMMAMFWTIVPAVAVAGIIVAIGDLVAQVVRDVVSSVLEGVGFDNLLGRLGLADLETKSEHLKAPSQLMGRIAYVAIVLVASVQALNTLGLSFLRDLHRDPARLRHSECPAGDRDRRTGLRAGRLRGRHDRIDGRQ